VPENDFNVIGRAAKAFLLEPSGPTAPPSPRVTPAATAEYGEYLANTVANCSGCHTRRSMRTGEQLGVAFAGGLEVESHSEPGTKFVTPNLTPHPETGHITQWSEDVFVARFKNGVATASPMPWDAYRNMTDGDLRALYRYLRSLPPARTGSAL
jgi:hypothetical protein